MSFYVEFSFPAHVALLDGFLDRSRHIVETIESRALNVQGRRGLPLGDRQYIEQGLSSCFFDSVPRDVRRLNERLSVAHRADGFEPVPQEGGAHDFNPAQLVALAHSYWANSRWAGRSGRIAYARTIYSAFVLNQLEQLSLRIWDEGNACATARLREIQRLLDRLNAQPGHDVFVRTAPWLLQTAQGPLTRLLRPYFTIADRISQSFEHDDRLQIHRAGALLAGGHLRSQLRYRTRESQATEERGLARTQATEEHGLTRTQAAEERGLTRTQAAEEHGLTRTQAAEERGLTRKHHSIDDPEILSVTRNSNSMDVALLIRDLVPLLEAYKIACATDATDIRQSLSDTILQGVSADPQLLLVRLDVLGPATTIEDVFIERKEDGRLGYTEFGCRHLDVLSTYRDLIGDLAGPLKDDAHYSDPTPSAYSPFAIVYGFCADILSNIAISRLISSETHSVALEDMFSSGDATGSRLAKARQWETLARRNPERARFEHSAEWAAEMFTGLVTALDRRAMHGHSPNASAVHSGRLFVVQEGQSEQCVRDIADNTKIVHAQEHCVTSDLKRALATGSTAFPRSQILSDRKEGRFLASVESEGKWFAVSKVLLTTCLCQGKDALITDVPGAVIDVLRLTCPEIVEIRSKG